MMTYIVYALFAFIIFLIYYINKYCRNKYFLNLCVGKKRSGKTLYLAYLANRHRKKRCGNVYSNFGVGQPMVRKTVINRKTNEKESVIDWSYVYPNESLILIDEAGIEANNRDFSSFPPEAREFFKYCGKRKQYVVLSSQTSDIDKCVRDLVDNVLVFSRLGFIGFTWRYKRDIKLVVNPQTGASSLQDTDKKVGFLPKIYTLPKRIFLSEEGYETEKEINKIDRE